MKTFYYLLMILASVEVHAQEVSHFKNGLACTDGKTFGWICHETEKIFVTGQGECVSDGQTVPCTWHGFQFEYIDFDEDTTFECNITTSMSLDIVNPAERVEEDIQTATYAVPVPAGTGNFFNPQYVTLGTNDEPLSRYDHTICYLNGIRAAEFSNEFIYPVQP